MRFNDRALIVGKTRSGKSTFALHLCSNFTGARVVVANIKGRLDVGVAPVFAVAAIDWTQRVINFVPRNFRRDTFEDFYAAVWAHRGVPTVVWLDEAAVITSPSYAPDMLLVIQQQGAEHGIGHVVVSQRAKSIKMELRTEAEELFIFTPPPSQADLQWLADEIGDVDGRALTAPELRLRLRELLEREGEHAFVWWRRATGELVDCAPLPGEWVRATLRELPARSPASSAPA